MEIDIKKRIAIDAEDTKKKPARKKTKKVASSIQSASILSTSDSESRSMEVN